MTKIDFYSGSTDKLRTACQLSHKAMQKGMRVVLSTPDITTTDELDKLLWQYPATAFIPHCRNDADDAGHMPVVLAHTTDELPHHELLINLNDECAPYFSRFERVIEIISCDEEDCRLGRERFKYYRDRGYQLSHTDLLAEQKS